VAFDLRLVGGAFCVDDALWGRVEEPTMEQHDKELDARGLNCPLPILRTKKSLADMTSGQILKILATDPGSVKDFQAFSKQTGNE